MDVLSQLRCVSSGHTSSEFRDLCVGSFVSAQVLTKESTVETSFSSCWSRFSCFSSRAKTEAAN
jgi:hypothetical protein